MRRRFLLGVLLLMLPAAAFAADKAQCDAKPFTLNKPKSTQTAEATPKTPASSAHKPAPPVKPAVTKPPPKPKQAPLVAGCKQPKGK